MKTREDAAKVLLDAGWTLEEVNSVLIPSQPYLPNLNDMVFRINSSGTLNYDDLREAISDNVNKQLNRNKRPGGMLS
jgi:hypothetical protein